MHEMVGNKIGSGVEDYCVAQQIINSLAPLFLGCGALFTDVHTLGIFAHIASSATDVTALHIRTEWIVKGMQQRAKH